MKFSKEKWINPKTTKARIVCYAIIQSSQWFSELTLSSSEASIYSNDIRLTNEVQIRPEVSFSPLFSFINNEHCI